MIKLPLLLYLSPVLLFMACGQPGSDKSKTAPYKMVDYVTVGKMMDTVKAPYIIDISNDKKRVIFIGCDHNYDPTHPQVTIIPRYFNALQPQIAFNEGGQVADSVHFSSPAEGAIRKGETGILKYLCDSLGIKMMNGDMDDSTEFSLMLKKYPHDKLFLYYVMERLVVPYLGGAYGKQPFEELYNKAINEWFVKPGFPLASDERSIDYFKQLFKKYTGHDFELKLTMDIELFDYINPDCEFCAIGRSSKVVRDSMLLNKIELALKKYDRIIVTFGHGHVLAVEPALQTIIHRQDP